LVALGGVARPPERAPRAAEGVGVGDVERAGLHVDAGDPANDNAGPAGGRRLGGGDLEAQVITCPWHGFQYDVKTGTCLTNAALSLGCHKVRLEGDSILVEV